MHKQALNVDPNEVGRLAVGGLMTGGSVAALWNLARIVKQELAARNAKGQETDENTIVVTLPKRASVEEGGQQHAEGEPKRPSKPETMSVREVRKAFTHHNGTRQDRDTKDQTFQSTGEQSTKSATGWPTMTAGALSAIAGTAAGAALVDKIFQMRREKELNAELAAAKQEYLQGLTSKDASYLADLFSYDDLHKQADFGDKTFGLINYPLAVTALLTILGGAGTAYVTKKVLDDKFKEQSRAGMDVPKVKRIVFRTGPPQAAGEKLASSDDIAALHACIGLLCDAVEGSTKVASSPELAAALQDRKLDPGQFVGMTKDLHALLGYLAEDPNLSRMVERAAMDRHPIMKHFKWALGIPFVKRIADRKLQRGIADAMQPHPYLSPEILRGRDIMQGGMEKQMSAKQAATMPSTAPLMIASMIGSSLGKGNVTEEVMKAEQELDKQKDVQDRRDNPDKALSSIAIETQDPEAQQYVKGNREKIRRLLRHMVEEGKL